MKIDWRRNRDFVSRIFQRFVEENFDQMSASLAFTTLISLVPLVAVVLSIMSVIPYFMEFVGRLDGFLARNILPDRSGGMIFQYVMQFSQRAANVTLIGLLGLTATVFLLLFSVEKAFNHVWRVTENRPWWKRLRLYVAALAVWPCVVVLIVLATTSAVTVSLGWVDEPPWLRSFLLKVVGLALTAFFFSVLYQLIPNARVASRDAIRAGFLAALGFLLMQKLFGLYLAYFPSYKAVYGAFATLPIFLLWLYLSWALVLLGALVAATLGEFRRGRATDPRSDPPPR